MKKPVAVLMVIVLSASLVGGCAKGYESARPAGELTVTLSVGSYPLVKGDNTLSVKVADSAGKAVTDAVVSVRYFMPPMPGMAPMDYSAQASPKGNMYAVSANIPMEGGWKVEVSVARPGKPAATATFNLDAR